MYKYLTTFFLVLVFSPTVAFAQATLFVSPTGGTYKVGDLFSILVNVNSGGESINAASGQLNFDNSKLEVMSLGYSASVFKIWTDEPNFSNVGGTIRFSGGVPNPGYTGASGAILRVTFKAKSQGQAPITFASGSVLANDGSGTNILDGFKGALFQIISASGKPAPVSATPAGEPATKATREESAPIITDWPKQVEEGSPLTIKGVGFPNGKVLVVFQKGEGEPLTQETFAGPDGRFASTYRRTAEAGFYRVWARSISAEGVPSPNSEAIIVEVTKPLFFRIGGLALNYISIIVTLLALLLLAAVLLGWSWVRLRKWHERQGREISEAERALHLGFDKLKEGLSAYVEYLTDTRSTREGKKRAEMTRKELKRELEDIEEDIGKEVEDIKKKRP